MQLTYCKHFLLLFFFLVGICTFCINSLCTIATDIPWKTNFFLFTEFYRTLIPIRYLRYIKIFLPSKWKLVKSYHLAAVVCQLLAHADFLVVLNFTACSLCFTGVAGLYKNIHYQKQQKCYCCSVTAHFDKQAAALLK